MPVVSADSCISLYAMMFMARKDALPSTSSSTQFSVQTCLATQSCIVAVLRDDYIRASVKSWPRPSLVTSRHITSICFDNTWFGSDIAEGLRDWYEMEIYSEYNCIFMCMCMPVRVYAYATSFWLLYSYLKECVSILLQGLCIDKWDKNVNNL